MSDDAPQQKRYHAVYIDGVQYIPLSERPCGEEERLLLCEVYGGLWGEAFYDAFNESTQKFADPLARKMMRLNELMGFKK